MTHLIPPRRTSSCTPLSHIAGAALLLALAAAPGARAAGSMTPLTFSFSQKTADFLPLWIASDAGYFKQRGLDVTVRYLPAQEGVPALLTGQVQIAGIGGADGVSAVAQGAKLKLVATLSPVYTFQFWARPQFASANALKGQRVGVTSTTGSLYAGTILALRELGLSTRDVAITPLGSTTNVNASLLAGSIAAASSHPPATYQFQRNGLVDLVDLAKKKIPSVNAGVIVTAAYIEAHRDIVQGVVDAVIEGIHREIADRPYAESEMRDHLGVKDKAVLDFTYDFYVDEVVRPVPMPQAAELASNKAALSATNAKVKTVDVAAMIDESFVKQAEK
jgi:NitT/TauT family transport system substrate-binding protein